MAETQQPTSGLGTSEKTFKSYTKDQGAKYAKLRPTYHEDLYKIILDFHTSNGAGFGTVLDVGCGPGTSTQDLAPRFEHAIGLDPSEGMIETARTLEVTTSTSEPIRFEISSAEDLGKNLPSPIADASVDLVTASTAAHWFDMAGFWPAAARVLKPGGTVAIWCGSSIRVAPDVPAAEAIQAVLDEMEDVELVPYFEKGNLLTRSLYVGLPLPWELQPPVSVFKEADYQRRVWDEGTADVGFLATKSLTANLDVMEALIGTASPVQRWREAHPETAGTDQDIIRKVRLETERLMHEAGVPKGEEMIHGALRGVLLLLKKTA